MSSIQLPIIYHHPVKQRGTFFAIWFIYTKSGNDFVIKGNNDAALALIKELKTAGIHYVAHRLTFRDGKSTSYWTCSFAYIRNPWLEISGGYSSIEKKIIRHNYYNFSSWKNLRVPDLRLRKIPKGWISEYNKIISGDLTKQTA